MANVIRLVLSVVFGLVWLWVYDKSGGASAIVILGSILTLCVCCCKSGGDPQSEWSWDRYFGCLRRCMTPLLILMIALFLMGMFWPVINGNPMPAGAAIGTLLVAAIGSVWSIRLICCLYDN